jgi:hypothetical protein
MALRFGKRKPAQDAQAPERRGGWYADPYGNAARRWYDQVDGWTDRVQEAGQTPDKTGLARMDEAAVADSETSVREEIDGHPVPLSRPVDPRYMLNARSEK